jgi:phage-related minor tail protein
MNQRVSGRVFSLAAILTLAFATLAGAQGKNSNAKSNEKQHEADAKEIRNFRLTEDKLNKYEAAAKAFTKLTQQNPDLKRQIGQETATSEDTTLDSVVKAFERHTDVAAAIKDAGMSTHDYVVMTFTMNDVATEVGMKRNGVIKEYPPSILPENAAFVDQNFDRVNSLLQSMTSAE